MAPVISKLGFEDNPAARRLLSKQTLAGAIVGINALLFATQMGLVATKILFPKFVQRHSSALEASQEFIPSREIADQTWKETTDVILESKSEPQSDVLKVLVDIPEYLTECVAEASRASPNSSVLDQLHQCMIVSKSADVTPVPWYSNISLVDLVFYVGLLAASLYYYWKSETGQAEAELVPDGDEVIAATASPNLVEDISNNITAQEPSAMDYEEGIEEPSPSTTEVATQDNSNNFMDLRPGLDNSHGSENSVTLNSTVYTPLSGGSTQINSDVTTELSHALLKQLQIGLQSNNREIEMMKEKILEVAQTAKSDSRNLQGRLNRGGDVRRELEKLKESLGRLWQWVYQLTDGNGATLFQNSGPLPYSQGENGQFSEEYYNVEQDVGNMISSGPMAMNQNGQSRCIVTLDGNRFDLGTSEGRNYWRTYMATRSAMNGSKYDQQWQSVGYDQQPVMQPVPIRGSTVYGTVVQSSPGPFGQPSTVNDPNMYSIVLSDKSSDDNNAEIAPPVQVEISAGSKPVLSVDTQVSSPKAPTSGTVPASIGVGSTEIKNPLVNEERSEVPGRPKGLSPVQTMLADQAIEKSIPVSQSELDSSISRVSALASARMREVQRRLSGSVPDDEKPVLRSRTGPFSVPTTPVQDSMVSEKVFRAELGTKSETSSPVTVESASRPYRSTRIPPNMYSRRTNGNSFQQQQHQSQPDSNRITPSRVRTEWGRN
ncbi:uncharacterized protein V1516DRAFT_683258 [Lipomyces oligophaga]|uniref:uncharacterized protein n=1 Tax=Lipomyces oligophaga TaxID=45792 RepID=UPI0034CE37D3